jgi:hypothetical protein
VFARLYSSSGTAQGPELQVNTYTTGWQVNPSVSSDADGNFVVVWQSSGQDGDGYGVFGQRYSSAGAVLGGEFRVNTYTTGHQRLPSVASAANGDFVVVWESGSQDDGGYGVFGQRYSSAGAVLGGEFQVNTYTTGLQRLPSVASDANGDFVVTWSGAGQGDTDGVFARRFSSSGAAQGAELRVNTDTTGQQEWPAVAGDGHGTFVVVWTGGDTNGFDVFGQRLTTVVLATPTPTATPTSTATSTPTATLTPTPTPQTLPGGGSATQQLIITEQHREVELSFQIVAPPIPGDCQVTVEVQPPSGPALSFPMTEQPQVQTIHEPQPGVWTITARSGSECPDFDYYLFVRAVPIMRASSVALLATLLGFAGVVLLRVRKGTRLLRGSLQSRREARRRDHPDESI